MQSGVQNGDRRVRAAGVWQSGRVLRGQEVPLTSCLLEVDFVWFRGGSVVPPLLASVAGSWQGGRRSGRHQPENLHPGCSWGGFSPGVEEPRGVGGVSASWGGVRAELCGADDKRDTTPEGWLFLKLLFEGE